MDARRDIYGLGAVGYYLLTGHPPFAGANSVMVIAALLRDEPPPPSRLQPDIPDDLERVILQCLAKNPGDRFQSAVDLDSAPGVMPGRRTMERSRGRRVVVRD